MSNEMMSASNNGALSAIPSMSLADFQREAFATTANRLTALSRRSGSTDTVMHVGTQLTSADIVGHALTIIRVQYANVPARDPKTNTPVFETDDNGVVLLDESGNPIQKFSIFPVCHFAEAPGYWYNGGKLLGDNIRLWAAEEGDEFLPDGTPADMTLPAVNAALEEIGGIRAYFAWKDKRDGSGQRYINMILA